MTAPRIFQALPWAAGALGLAVASLASAYAVELALVPSAHPPAFAPLPAAYDAQAARALGPDPARARTLSLKALAISPADGRAWITVAMALDARRGPHFNPEGLSALQRSYDVAPYDAQLLADRVALAYDHWAELPSETRQETLSEIRTAWPFPDQRNALFEATNRARDPVGKLTLALELFRLRFIARPPGDRPKPVDRRVQRSS